MGMKRKFLGLIVLIFVLFSFSGCGLILKQPKDNSETDIVAGTQNMYQETIQYVQYQVDSMCVADKLPRNFEGWISNTYQDYETQSTIVRHMYIKEMNDKYEMVYIVTQ